MQLERSPYYLVTAGAKPGRLGDTALEARQLLDLVFRRDAHDDVVPDDEQPQVLVILDCCFSGAGGIEALKESLQGMGNPKVWVLATASSVEYAQQGRFAAALRQALLDPEAGSSQRLLGLDRIVEKINATLGHAGQRARYIPPGGESTGLPPFFPNPKYVPSVAGLTVAEQHWVSRLRGAPAGSTAAGFYITGRTGRMRVVEDLASWMRDPDRGGLAVVTGSPGSGKSAMLALPVLLTNGQGRDVLVAGAGQGSLVPRAADLFDGLPVLGVHARGMNPYQVADTLGAYLGRSADSPEELLGDLEDRPETSSRIVVIDAVDEARDPRRLLTELLLPLGRRPGLRVIVGGRRHVVPSAADISLLVDLDSDNYRDPQALTDYAYQLLSAAHDSPLPGHMEAVNSVAFGTGADWSLLATGGNDGTVRLWDPVTGAPAGEPLTGHTGAVNSVAFGTGPDGRLLLASGSEDKTVRLWDPVTGAPAGGPLTGHTNYVYSVASGTGPGGRLLLASGSEDKTVRLWDPVTGAPAGEPLTGHRMPVTSVAFGTGLDGRLLLASGSWDKAVWLWDPLTGASAAGRSPAIRAGCPRWRSEPP